MCVKLNTKTKASSKEDKKPKKLFNIFWMTPKNVALLLRAAASAAAGCESKKGLGGMGGFHPGPRANLRCTEQYKTEEIVLQTRKILGLIFEKCRDKSEREKLIQNF